MSNFDDGLVIGLAIGKKKFKGGKKYDSIFHDIIENIVPIIEHYDLGAALHGLSANGCPSPNISVCMKTAFRTVSAL